MNIRSYRERDILRIMEIYNETTKEFNWSDLNEDQKKIILLKDISISNQIMISNITLILEIKDKIIGFVVMKENGYINFLYVDKEEINKGYGKNLMDSIERKAKEI